MIVFSFLLAELVITFSFNISKQGKILFGIFLRYDIVNELDSSSYLEVGQEVHPNSE